MLKHVFGIGLIYYLKCWATENIEILNANTAPKTANCPLALWLQKYFIVGYRFQYELTLHSGFDLNSAPCINPEIKVVLT